MSSKFTTLFAALLVSTSLVATAAEASAAAKNPTTQTQSADFKRGKIVSFSDANIPPDRSW